MSIERLTPWVRAARPRTLLLSFTGVMLGGFLAAATGFFYPVTAALAAVTAMLLQVLSNLANDYGDFKKGLDNPDRVGPQRALQSGELTESQMRRGIVVMGVAAIVTGAALLLSAWSHIRWMEFAVFALLGLAAIAAALLYTLGKHPYGYRGLGDLFCFLFFGWVAVAGTYYLSTPQFDLLVFLPATAMGFLATAVLNINNMRDYENDKANGKHTLVVKIGLKKAFVYHIFLVILPFLCLTLFLILKHVPWYAFGCWLMFPFFLMDLFAIRKTLYTSVPDRFLPKQVVKSFLLIFLFVFSIFML